MEESQRQEIARAVLLAKDETLKQTVVYWPTTSCAPAFAAVLARAWRPGTALSVLVPRQGTLDPDLAWLRGRTEVTLLDPGGATLREQCSIAGIARLVTATRADVEPEVAAEWSLLLEGVSPEALATLTYTPGVCTADSPDLAAIAMQRMHKLGYL
ncbi:hypothetical protein [Sphingomonas sp. UV9]|uniref:hypothetical protein n=1 Tax=Sphingomonas sp. UV9 TaxID=1851410 RepID=UPI0013E8BCB8|nr:hypothetical protein [Sphingomonas sp. UV9]